MIPLLRNSELSLIGNSSGANFNKELNSVHKSINSTPKTRDERINEIKIEDNKFEVDRRYDPTLSNKVRLHHINKRMSNGTEIDSLWNQERRSKQKANVDKGDLNNDKKNSDVTLPQVVSDGNYQSKIKCKIKF